MILIFLTSIKKYWLIIASFCFIVLSCNDASVIPIDNTGTGNLKDTIMLNKGYGVHPRQVMDIHLPAKRDSNTPVVIMIHGGAWQAGKKEDLNGYVNLTKARWKEAAIVNINYRLASSANNIHHNQIVEDLNSVVQHIKDNKTNYVISANIGILGVSAGGQLAMIYAYKYNPEIKCVGNIFGPSMISDWSWYNSYNLFLGAHIRDILTNYVGQPWNKDLYDSVSPYWNVNGNSQPTIIFHGSLDPVVPVAHSRSLRSKLNDLGITHQYHEYLAFHSFDNSQSVDVLSKLVAFFKVHIE